MDNPALLLIAGIDTTWSAIGAPLWHLAKTPGDRERLVAEPANRDPAQFDWADEVVIDREVNRHAAFGLGIHRCIGSHLARMEFRVALGAWLDRIPRFSLDDPATVTWAAGQVRGPRALPPGSADLASRTETRETPGGLPRPR